MTATRTSRTVDAAVDKGVGAIKRDLAVLGSGVAESRRESREVARATDALSRDVRSASASALRAAKESGSVAGMLAKDVAASRVDAREAFDLLAGLLAESAEETRRREAREFAEAEHWARVEREDEAREEARAPGGSREEKAREKKERKRENAKAKEKASKAKASSASDEKWADFDRRWAALESEDASSAYPTLTYERVPWPPRMTETLRRAAKGATKEDVKTWKAAYRASLMRWHPDKFAARHARRLHEDDRERILTRVNAVARAITAAFAKG